MSSEFICQLLEIILNYHERVLHFTVCSVFAFTQVFSEFVFESGVAHDKHSSSGTGDAIFGRSGGPDPSVDIN